MARSNKYSLKSISVKCEEVESFIYENGTVFHSYDFLSSVGDNYICHIVYSDLESENIIAVLPLVKSSKYKVKSYNLPPLTYLYGPVLSELSIADKKKIISLLLNAVSSDSRVDLKCFADGDILPYISEGYTVDVRQSHVFSKNKVYSAENLSKNKRRDLIIFNRLLEEGDIKLVTGEEAIEHILYLWKITSERSNFTPHIDLLQKIVSSGVNYYSNVILDKEGEPLAGTICPYDKKTMYHLVSAGNRVENKMYSRMNILSLFSAVKEANDRDLDFDFEGSGIEGVAKYYRLMGGEPIVVNSCVKTNSLYYKVVDFIKSI